MAKLISCIKNLYECYDEHLKVVIQEIKE